DEEGPVHLQRLDCRIRLNMQGLVLLYCLCQRIELISEPEQTGTDASDMRISGHLAKLGRPLPIFRSTRTGGAHRPFENFAPIGVARHGYFVPARSSPIAWNGHLFQ